MYTVLRFELIRYDYPTCLFVMLGDTCSYQEFLLPPRHSYVCRTFTVARGFPRVRKNISTVLPYWNFPSLVFFSHDTSGL